MTKFVNSIAFRVVIPVLGILLVIGAGLYLFLLRSISDFADRHIAESVEEMSHDIYGICDEGLGEIFKLGLARNQKEVRIKKGLVLGKIEDFMRQNDVHGVIYERGKEILRTEHFPAGLSEMAVIERSDREDGVSSMRDRGIGYYTNHIVFEPWRWHIVMVKSTEAYSALLRRVNLAYGLTGFLLFAAGILLVSYLDKAVRHPLKQIIEAVRSGRHPDYKGIHEFEFLSENIRGMAESLQHETSMLNNLYHIAVSKRGEDFFSDVALAVSRLFGLNCLIGRVSGDNRADVAALCMNGDLKKGFTISLSGTPCEGVLAKKHMVVIEKGVHREFPSASALVNLQAESYIGFAVFNRRGEVIGILNAFGKQREFKEADIKVLQTIGQMVAAEFERQDEEREKARMQEQLYQAQKMEAIGTLAGGIAHDFNNMLQGILGYASLLKGRTPEADQNYKAMEVIEHLAERAAELTKQLLGFARKGKVVVEAVNMNEVVDDALKIVTRTFDRAIEIQTSLSGDLWTIEADRSQIEHIVLNLCLNARDAMPNGGLLKVATYNTEVKEKSDIHPWLKRGRYAAITISDNGSGMDDEVKKHIFEPFFTTKERGKGTGMGLAMVYGVVKNHHGFIFVESGPEKGSAFTVYFPPADRAVPEQGRAIRDLPHGQGTILVVDDEPFIRNLAQDLLRTLGYRVLLASDGEEALRVYASNKGTVDLVLLDLIMPKLGGREVFQRLKDIDPDVKVLIASGFAGDEETAEGPDSKGLLGFIQKPYSLAEIAERIKRACSAV